MVVEEIHCTLIEFFYTTLSRDVTDLSFFFQVRLATRGEPFVRRADHKRALGNFKTREFGEKVVLLAKIQNRGNRSR